MTLKKVFKKIQEKSAHAQNSSKIKKFESFVPKMDNPWYFNPL